MYLAMSISGWITTIVPKVDKQFVEFFPQYANYEGDILWHHHVGGGGQTYAIPSILHSGYGGVHNYEKKQVLQEIIIWLIEHKVSKTERIKIYAIRKDRWVWK